MEAAELPERKARKSVAFTEEKLVVDADGSVSMISSPNDDNKDTAVSHSPPPVGDDATNLDGGGEDGGLDLSLMKKKKKKPKKDVEDEADGDDGAAPADDGGLDLSMKKKKKKKKPAEGDDDFAAKLKALEIEGEDGEEAEAQGEEVDKGDMDKGTGMWSHDEVTPLPFPSLLERFYKQLEERNPDHATSGSRSYKIPPPQCLREGNKKTIFANIVDIANRMKRTEEHVTAYLFAELGTSGSVDGSRRLVIKGRFQQKQIESMLRKYIIEYVACKTCRSPDTLLEKGENRLSFITCQNCGSRRSVAAIKTGFSAQVGKRRKMQG